jgi:hypothetical protein
MNPVLAKTTTSNLIDSTAMPFGRVLRAYAVEAKYESLRMLRTPAFAGPFLALPVALYLLFAVLLFGAEIAKDPQGALFTFMGFSLFGVMGPGMFGFGITVAMEREQGLLKLKRALQVQIGFPHVGTDEYDFGNYVLAIAAKNPWKDSMVRSLPTQRRRVTPRSIW